MKFTVIGKDDPRYAQSLIEKTRQTLLDKDMLYLTFAWFTAIVDEVREGIDMVGFTLDEVSAVLRHGELGRITSALCAPGGGEQNNTGGGSHSTHFQEKAKRLPLPQRAGTCFALHESWRAGEAENREAILARFKLHGIHLLC